MAASAPSYVSRFCGLFFTLFGALSTWYTLLSSPSLWISLFCSVLIQMAAFSAPSHIKGFGYSSLCIGKELSLLFLHDIKDQATSSWDLCLYWNSLPRSPQPPPPSSICSLLTVPGVSSSLVWFSSVKCCLEHSHSLQQFFFFKTKKLVSLKLVGFFKVWKV